MAPAKAPKCLREAWAAEQERIAQLCVSKDELDWSVHGHFIHGLKYVAGVDVSFFPDGLHAVAAVVVVSFPHMEVVYERCATFKLKVPYMPGFLAFREVPAMKAMLEMVPTKWRPQAVLVDGNGVFHPRRCGSATHLGVLTDLPTIGVAKDILKVGDINVNTARQVAQKLQGASDWAPLVADENHKEPLAVLLRPSSSQKTVVVSAGHKISLDTALVLTASLCKASIPEPIRQADLRSRAAVRAWFAGTPVSKLKLAKQEGAGDLLQLGALSESMDQANSTLNCAVPEVETRALVNSRDLKGATHKRQLKWRIKQTSKLEAAGQKQILSCLATRIGDDGLHSAIATWTLPQFETTPDTDGWSLWNLFQEYFSGFCMMRQ